MDDNPSRKRQHELAWRKSLLAGYDVKPIH